MPPEIDVFVGFAAGALQPLRDLEQPQRVVLFEHPDVISKRGIAQLVRDDPLVIDLVAVAYDDLEQVDAALDSINRWSVRSILPVNDYATPFAAKLAERLGLPNAGVEASRIMRDKHTLRQVADQGGLRVPRWRRADTLVDARKAAADLGYPVILKPTDRQASVGTIVVATAADLDDAWAYSADRDEGNFARDWREANHTLVEEYVVGPEYSVECLVVDGAVVFANVTGKRLFPGLIPVEQGHRIPAQLDDAHKNELQRATERVLDVCRFRTGITHVEWKLSEGAPVLIEAAGRFAGDGIVEAISHAYDFNLVEAYRTLMRGEEFADTLPEQAARTAAIGFLAGEPGRVVHAELATSLLERKDVISAHLMVKTGQTAPALTSSWDRWASVSVTADDHPGVEKALTEALELIDIRVESEPE